MTMVSLAKGKRIGGQNGSIEDFKVRGAEQVAGHDAGSSRNWEY